jgi:hypothetical protein
MNNKRYYIARSLDEIHPLDKIVCEIQFENPMRMFQGNKRINNEFVWALLVERHKTPSRFSFYRRK